LHRQCGYMIANIIVDGTVVKRIKINTPRTGAGTGEYRTIVKLLLDGTIVDAKIGKAYGC